MEWCAEADRYRCMRCGRGSKDMKMSGRCNGTKILVKKFLNMGRRHLTGHDLVRRMDRQGEVLIWCRKCSGYARQRMGTEANELLHAGTDGHQRIWQNGENNPNTRGRESPSQRGKELENRDKHTRKEYRRLLNNFEMEGVTAQGRPVEVGKGKNYQGKRRVA